MPKLDISGIEVNFPYDPYGIYISFIKTISFLIKLLFF